MSKIFDNLTINGTVSGTTILANSITTNNLISNSDISFTNGITASTVSASTYENLPLNIYVTGMTFNTGNYDLTLTKKDGTSITQSLSILSSDMTVTGGSYNENTGVVTFTNNSGGTFGVSGFTTGYTDTYVTGGTYNSNNGTLTLTRSNGISTSPITGFSTNTRVIHTHGFNGSTIGNTSASRWSVFSELTMLSATISTTNPTYPLAARYGLIPKTGTITSAKINWYITGGASTQNHILTFRNQTTTTTYTVTSAFQIGPNFSGIAKTYVVSGLNIPVTENDVVFSVIESPIMTPSAPSGVYMIVDYIIE
jgi:hypothetical protein